MTPTCPSFLADPDQIEAHQVLDEALPAWEAAAQVVSDSVKARRESAREVDPEVSVVEVDCLDI